MQKSFLYTYQFDSILMIYNCLFSFCAQKFLYYVLKSSDVLDVLVPILFHLNDSRADQCEFYDSVPVM